MTPKSIDPGVCPTLGRTDMVSRLDVDLGFLASQRIIEADHRPLEPVEITVKCPNHDIAYDVIMLIENTYFPDDDGVQENGP